MNVSIKKFTRVEKIGMQTHIATQLMNILNFQS